MESKTRFITLILTTVLIFTTVMASYGQSGGRRRQTPPPAQPREVNRYRVVGGVRNEVGAHALPDSVLRDTAKVKIILEIMFRQSDSLSTRAARGAHEADSIVAVNPNRAAFSDSLRREAAAQKRVADSLVNERNRLITLMPVLAAVQDSLRAIGDTIPELSRREQRKIERLERDSVRYSIFFRDTLPLSRMTALSFVAPGLGQLHNKQYWKIPVLYATVGTTAYLGFQQNKCFQRAKTVYDELIFYGYTRENSDLDRVQRVMIQHNQRRQLWFGLAAASYLYFICDGVMNHPGTPNNVKIATTLSTIIPGAGQIYNRSYWKVPIVMGSFATMAMMIDWNNRGYQRFKLAYDLLTTGGVVEEPLRRSTATELANYRRLYRRNRDLCIILTGLVYLINIVDAHVDAHMKDFDVSDDLNLIMQPTLSQVSTTRGGTGNAFGVSMSLKF